MDPWLRAINPTVPLIDLQAAVALWLLGALVALAIAAPPLCRAPRTPCKACRLLLAFALATILASAWTLHQPRHFQLATLVGYAMMASASLGLAARISQLARLCAIIACAVLALALCLVNLLAFAPR